MRIYENDFIVGSVDQVMLRLPWDASPGKPVNRIPSVF